MGAEDWEMGIETLVAQVVDKFDGSVGAVEVQVAESQIRLPLAGAS